MGAEMGTEGKEGLGEEYRHKAKCAQKTPSCLGWAICSALCDVETSEQQRGGRLKRNF